MLFSFISGEKYNMFTFNFRPPGVSDEKTVEEEEVCELVEEIDPKCFSDVLFPFENPGFVALKDGFKIKLVSKENIKSLLQEAKEECFEKAEKTNSDLLPGIYEGGLTVWECTMDLCSHLQQEDISFEGKTVLDLGCGAGILGIMAKKLGASTVDFQDFNSCVLKYSTIPHLVLNLPPEVSVTRSRFLAGDWGGFKAPQKYDYILSSETIYNVQSYPKLHRALKENLKPDGVVFLSAKSYYFGVGGSAFEFCSYVESKDVFVWREISVNSDNVKRCILVLRFKQK